MAIFKDTTITDNGRALIADTLANNKQIIFTRMITSSKIYEDLTDVSKLTNIDEIKQTVSMSKISQEGTRVRLNAVFTNSTVNTSYKIQTIGLYAKTGTGNEILYSITRAKEPDVMPATNGINLATVEIDLITEINNSNGATMLMNPSTLVTTSNLVAELEKIAGLEFGGNIQDIGNKTKGKFYYDNVTKFYYECIEDNSLTYNDSGKFRAISNKPISDKVEKLFEFKNGQFKIGNIIFKFGITNYYARDGINATRFVYDSPFPNACLFLSATDIGGGANSVGLGDNAGKGFSSWGKRDNVFTDTTFWWIAIGF